MMSSNPDKKLFLWVHYWVLLAFSQLWGWLRLQNNIWIYKINIRVMSSICGVSTRMYFRSLRCLYYVSALIVRSYGQGLFVAIFGMSLNDIFNNLRHSLYSSASIVFLWILVFINESLLIFSLFTLMPLIILCRTWAKTHWIQWLKFRSDP